MTNEEKLETIVQYYRQKLADEQLAVANLTATIQELNAQLAVERDEKEQLRVQLENQSEPTEIANPK